ncbi:MAG: hypothetical protein HYV06_02970 [Deltaproteobacteria bacterium]|nr:hypothetical protein [Deltaproteobacteria bacterium]
MNLVTNRYENAIKPLKRRFWIGAALFIVLSTACAAQERERRKLEKTHKELVRAKDGLARVRQAILNRKHSLETLRTQLGQGVEKSSSERLIYGRIDDIQSRLKPDDISITAMEKKGGDASLQYTLKFTNTSYSNFINAVCYLQQTVFPFTPVDSITVSQAEVNGRGVVAFTVVGKVLSLDRGLP